MQNGACKNGGGRPGQFYHVNDISVYLGRQRGGGVPGRRTSFGAFSKRKTLEQNAYFRPGTPPPSVYLGRHQLIHMIKWTRPSPSVLPTATDQKLDDGKAWERGYLLSLLPWHVQWQTSFRSTHSWVPRFTRNSVFQAIFIWYVCNLRTKQSKHMISAFTKVLIDCVPLQIPHWWISTHKDPVVLHYEENIWW